MQATTQNHAVEYIPISCFANPTLLSAMLTSQMAVTSYLNYANSDHSICMVCNGKWTW
jgi:hypothetical protein